MVGIPTARAFAQVALPTIRLPLTSRASQRVTHFGCRGDILAGVAVTGVTASYAGKGVVRYQW